MLIFIGTLHGCLTPHPELIELVEGFNPFLVLVEIAQADMENGTAEKYPDEMQAILAWATAKHIDVNGFDSDINVLKTSISDESLKTLDEEQSAITSKHDWKDFNRPEYDTVLETKTWQKIVDIDKAGKRNHEMYKNIIKLIRNCGNNPVVVITGSGHIAYFRSKFPRAQFPLSG